MPKTQLILSALFVFLISFAKAQIKAHAFLADHVKNGIYLSAENFNRNEPAVTIDHLTNESFDLLKATPAGTEWDCLAGLQYIDPSGQIVKLSVGKIWGIVMDGNLYVKHARPIKASNRLCFYQLLYFGTLSKYFVTITRQEFHGTAGGVSTYSPTRSVTREFTIDLRTGEVFNTKNQLGKIKDIIKSDASFAGQKINKDNLDEYIAAYNKKNIHPNVATNSHFQDKGE